MTSHPSPSTHPFARGHIPSLDGLRGVAILMVLVAHAVESNGFPTSPAFSALGRRCVVGVDLFFVISGFLITTLMLREVDRTGRLSIRQFYLRRVLRILPAYSALLLFLALLHSVGFVRIPVRDWVGALTYTVNFIPQPTWEIGHAWSLSIEEHFYLLWPLVIALGLSLAPRIAVAVIFISFSLRWTFLLAFPQYCEMAELWTFTRLDTIAFGCLLALAVRIPLWRASLDRFCHRNVLLALLFAALLLSLWLSPRSGKIHLGLSFTFHALAITLLLYAAISRPAALFSRLLNTRLLSAIGLISYSLYLWQQFFLNRTRSGLLFDFPQNLLFAALAATLSYRFIESPFLRLKDRLQTRFPTAPAETAAPLPPAADTAPPLMPPLST